MEMPTNVSPVAINNSQNQPYIQNKIICNICHKCHLNVKQSLQMCQIKQHQNVKGEPSQLLFQSNNIICPLSLQMQKAKYYFSLETG